MPDEGLALDSARVSGSKNNRITEWYYAKKIKVDDSKNSCYLKCPHHFMGFPCSSAGKESACNAGDLGSIPGLGRSPEEGKRYPLQYSGLDNSMGCVVHGVTKSQTRLSDFHFYHLIRRVGDPYNDVLSRKSENGKKIQDEWGNYCTTTWWQSEEQGGRVRHRKTQREHEGWRKARAIDTG